eukprot:365763-Chlamydomonas_euryale.AAC.27
MPVPRCWRRLRAPHPGLITYIYDSHPCLLAGPGSLGKCQPQHGGAPAQPLGRVKAGNAAHDLN